MNIKALKFGDWVAFEGNVGQFIARKGKKLAQVHFHGRTTSGHFGQIKGGCDVLASNLTRLVSKTPD